MNIGSGIESLRKKKKISQASLAQKTGLTQTYISLIESNKKKPSTSALEAIAKALDIPLPVFFLLFLDDIDIPENRKKEFELLWPSLKVFIEAIFSESLVNNDK